MICPFCKEEIKDGAIKCKHCGSILGDSNRNAPLINFSLPPQQSKISAQVNQGAFGCIIGGALMMVSPLFPWATAFGSTLSANGFDKFGASSFFLILFGLVILYGGMQT